MTVVLIRFGFALATLLVAATAPTAFAQEPTRGTTLSVPQQTTASPATTPATQSNAPEPNLLIGSGDLLEVSVYGIADFNKQVRVNDNGGISLPLLGEVKVAGMTAREAERMLERVMVERSLFAEPQVSVFVKEYATQAVSILGEVQKPGIYPLLGQRTLFDAISAAGGTTVKAGDKVTITHRNRPNEAETIKLSYDQNQLAQTNVPIVPGDTVVVAKAGIVYVVGDVRTPSGLVMQDSRLTVLQAIAMSQGTNQTASLNNAKLIRKTPAGQQEIPIKLKSILASKAPDVELQPDDILFVPSSAAKSAGRRGLEVILQTVSGIAVYRR